jgi:hypothetical protein
MMEKNQPMNNRMRGIGAMVCLVWLACGNIVGRAADGEELPHFQEILRLIRTNLPGVNESELNQALVEGLMERFKPRVQLRADDETPPPQAEGPWVSRVAVYDENVGYLRVSAVGAGLAEELSARWSDLRGTNQINALVLDLRFAAGQDYAAAAQSAELFVRGEKPLLAWDDTVLHSEGKGGAFLPLAVLVNGETQGAAEALAAALREAGTALIIGSQTVGQAYVYREFALEGSTLRIASMPVETGKGMSLKDGVRPDIEARLPPDKERIFYADPYATLPGETVALPSSRPRITEAELVRRRREGGMLVPFTGADEVLPGSPVPGAQGLRDPALVQALDILKGIVIVGPSVAGK